MQNLQIIQLLFLVLRLMVYQRYLLNKYKNKTFRIPMLNNSRSLNLSNAAAIVAYEAWKSLNFSGEGL